MSIEIIIKIPLAQGAEQVIVGGGAQMTQELLIPPPEVPLSMDGGEIAPPYESERSQTGFENVELPPPLIADRPYDAGYEGMPPPTDPENAGPETPAPPDSEVKPGGEKSLGRKQPAK